eukprot:158386-Amphidinium_carterae.2
MTGVVSDEPPEHVMSWQKKFSMVCLVVFQKGPVESLNESTGLTIVKGKMRGSLSSNFTCFGLGLQDSACCAVMHAMAALRRSTLAAKESV